MAGGSGRGLSFVGRARRRGPDNIGFVDGGGEWRPRAGIAIVGEL